MPPGTRSGSEKGDDNVIINFLRSAEFGELMRAAISKAVAKETKILCDNITQLELKINNLEMKNSNLCDECNKLNKNKSLVKGKDLLQYNVSHPETTKTNAIDIADVTKKSRDKNNFGTVNIQGSTETNRPSNMETNQPPNTDKNDWKVVTRKRQQQPIVRGSATGNSNIKAATKYAHFHVFRLEPNLSTEDLEAYLKSKKVEDVKCLKITSKRPEEYSSFKVTVPSRLENLILDPMTWPQDVCVNRFLSRLWKEDLVKK